MNFTLHTEFSDRLKVDWDQLLETNLVQAPFLEFDYQKLWWETRGGGEWTDAELMILEAHQNGVPVGIAPLFTIRQPDGSTAVLNVGSVEVSDFLDLLVRPEFQEAFIAALLNNLIAMHIPGLKIVQLFNLLDSSPTLPVLHSAAGKAGWTLSVERLQHSPCITLAGDWETYLAGIDKKQRHEIRRKMRRAEEADVSVKWYFAEDESSLDAEIDGFLELMKNDGDKDSFLKPPMQGFLRRVVHNAFNHKNLQLAFLEVDGHKAASYLSFDYRNKIWVYNSGLNRDFQALSPGWVLLGHLIQWSIEHGRTEFDFMRGDEEYKYRFGAVDRFVMRADLTPPAS
ncbi:GNAT family N-acetyltransferase [Leptolinea tardivitalis]|uniref:BioF2-like acetyltransferase domain-containing protein n=1 Tax=Leptolinea tardivitalis TaxID=229920 RepID=A0A0P6WVR5_9CHLR|nr:GNAT family N-acetyltransferase [Leptolinea tardivitalis]KPL70614.1 hypothetical protein ADM99_16045 [Leptolinea tardivitalis]GAP22232.1 protein [Leptolinea tardivitalis]